MGKGEVDSSIESSTLLLKQLFNEGHGVHQRLGLTSLEPGGYCIDGVEQQISYPRE